jgi:Tfp pilus assembly protein PilF
MIFLIFSLFWGCVTQQRIRRSQSRTELGIAFLVEGNASQAIRTLVEATQLNPRNAKAWEKLGLSYASQGASERAEKAFLRSLKIEKRAETHNNFGLMLLSDSRYTEAIPHFKAASTDITYRNIAISLNNLGQTYHLLGRNQEALQSLSNAIRRAPNLCQARFLRGVVHRDLEMKGKALSDFQEVIRLCGDNAFGAYYQAAELLIETSDVPAACSYLQTIQREVPNTPLSNQAKETHAKVCL